ncbi:MAG TPA: hypothetical protein VMZ73_08460, partial [Acidimicrobiales bacterium]|nr:hypothetical protein [Acidimicrobiales bacterium]
MGAPQAVPIIVVSRMLSAPSAIPTSFLDDSPEWAPPVVAVRLRLMSCASDWSFEARASLSSQGNRSFDPHLTSMRDLERWVISGAHNVYPLTFWSGSAARPLGALRQRRAAPAP